MRFSEFYHLAEEFFSKMIMGKMNITKTLGIITAENPGFDNRLTRIGNDRKNKKLAEDIEKLGYIPIPLRGKFAGKHERPFMVVNIDRNKLIELGNKYKQHAVIFGEKVNGELEFKYISHGRTTKTGKISLEHPDNMLDTNCYFTLSGQKFKIAWR
jgi:hypothetical protein